MSVSPSSRMRRLLPAEMDELRKRLGDRAEEVAVVCWGEPAVRRRNEWRWGSGNGSLSLVTARPKRGLWYDRASGEGGDLLTMLRQANGGSFARAIAHALAITGYLPESQASDLNPEERQTLITKFEVDRARLADERAKKQAKEKTKNQIAEDVRIARARKIWAGAQALAGTPAWLYLTRTRGIPEPTGGFPADLGWHPGERALIMAVRSPSGVVTAVQLVRLTPDGHKRQTSLVKQTFGPLRTAEGPSLLRLPPASMLVRRCCNTPRAQRRA